MTVTDALDAISVGGEVGSGYAVEIVQEMAGDEPVFVARHPELPGCMSHGKTIAEAEQNLAEARAMYLAALNRAGQPVPRRSATPNRAVLVTTTRTGFGRAHPPTFAWTLTPRG